MVSIIETNDKKEYYLNGLLHREDGPAVEHKNGDYDWYLHGKKHREDGPATFYSYGITIWYQNDKMHREGGPAYIHKDYNGRYIKEFYLRGKLYCIEKACGDTFWYCKKDTYHRLDGPAVEIKNKYKAWYINGIRHRIDAPAMEFKRGTRRWWVDGKRIKKCDVKKYQVGRIQSMAMAFSPMELPPYVILWILQWSESAYIQKLSEIAIVKMLEGIYNSRERIKDKVKN